MKSRKRMRREGKGKPLQWGWIKEGSKKTSGRIIREKCLLFSNIS